MSNIDLNSELIRVKNHVGRQAWEEAENQPGAVSDPQAIFERIVRMGFMSTAAYLEALDEKDKPWLYFDADEDEEFLRAVAQRFSAEVMGENATSLGMSTTATARTPVQSSRASGNSPTSPARALVKDPYEGLLPDQQAALKRMEEKLIEVNGQDAYSVTAMALGTLRKSEYLLLPEDMRHVRWPTDPAMVGAPWDVRTSVVKFRDFVQIYALNKEAGKESKDPVFFGLLRAEAVKMGWYMGQKEVMYVPAKEDAVETYLGDMQQIEEVLEAARSTAFLIPFMAEYVFRTTGHHYLTGLADEYERKYTSMCGACLVPNLTRYLRANELWHWSMHWVSPRVARLALIALKGTERLPNAIALRSDAAPAGTAIVTTTAAVIAAMESCNWASEVEKEGGFDFKKIKGATADVKANVETYHAAYFAYGVSAPSQAEKEKLAAAVHEAQKFAPIAQGFIDAMYSDSSLARAKALRKHADASPVLQRRALRVFRALAKADTEEISDIFRSTSADKKPAKTGGKKETTGAT